MARIILLGPLTSGKILTTLVRLTFVKVLAVLVLDVVLRYLDKSFGLISDTHPVLQFFNSTIFPLLHYPLWLGGVDITPEQDGLLAGLATLLLLILLASMGMVASFVARVRAEYNEKLASTGSLNGAPHRSWFLASLCFAAIIYFVRIQADPQTAELPLHFFYLLRLTATCMAGAGAIACLYIGWCLYQFWRLQNPTIPKAAKTKAPKLQVINGGAKTSASQPPRQAAPNHRALLVALTAEIIQFCGTQNRLPTAAELSARLAPLLRAALVTGNGMPSASELESLCQQALTLLDKGKLKPMSNLKEACKLYKSPGDSIDKIVHQLELNLKL